MTEAPERNREPARVAGALPWPLEVVASALARRPRAAEALLLATVLAAGLAAARPFLHDGIMGGVDARWYTSVVADHLEQWRLGMGPVFVGQTRFSAVGSVLPIRVAPYLQHLTLAIDVLTFRALSVYMVLNLAIVASCVGAALSAYLCLRSIISARRLEALGLAVVYAWSPAVAGLAYNGQLFMSVMTLPYLPVVFAGVHMIFTRDTFMGWAMVAGGCAACWMAHSPIGFWISASAAAAIALRWALGLGWHPRDALRAAGAGALFLGLCGYAFVSTRALAAPDASSVALQTLLPVVRSMFPGVLKPLSPLAGSASDLQPGWSVLAALIAGALGAFATRSRPTLALSIVALLLLCLSLPVPLATAALWRAVPQAVLDMTNAFPAQRLFPVLAAGAVVLCASALAAARWRRRWVVPGLLAAVAWSGFELGHMVHRGALIANSRATSDELMAQCNLITTTFATTLLPSISAFFSYGFTDYELEQRILDDPKGSYIATNAGAIAPGFDFNSAPVQRPLHGQLVGTPAANGRQWIDLNPALILAPHRHYLLALEFTGGPYAGVLQIKGSALSHEYYLPDSGGRFAFGSGPVNAHVTPLWNPTDTPMELRLDFVVQDPAGDLARFRDFARYELIPYEPGDLPIQLKSFAPYAARVRSASAGWLETFRYNLPGWTAIVNGRPSPVRQTPNGLIAVPIPAGESEVMLAYRPPAVLRACYWVTAACWFGFVAAWAARALRR